METKVNAWDVELVPVKEVPYYKEILWGLLLERTSAQCISHNAAQHNILHTTNEHYKSHCNFVDNCPYKAWYMLMMKDEPIGAVYLTKKDEIGLFIFSKYQHNGFGAATLKKLIEKHSDVQKFLANINPENRTSMDFFEKWGFKHIQKTYEYLNPMFGPKCVHNYNHAGVCVKCGCDVY